MKNKIFLFGLLIGIAICHIVDVLTDLVLKIIMILNK